MQEVNLRYALLNDTDKALKEANPQTRLINGRPTIVVENTKEFAAATKAAWKRIAPLIDGKVKQLRRGPSDEQPH